MIQKVLLITITLIFLSGCQSLRKDVPVKVGEQDLTMPSETADQHFQTGDEIKISDRVFVVLQTVDYLEQYEALQPPAGFQYIAVEVSLKNEGKNDLSYNPLDFKLQDDSGYSYDISWLAKQQPSFDTGTLYPGDTIRGFITYSVKNDTNNLKLVYYPDIWQKNKVTVDLNR